MVIFSTLSGRNLDRGRLTTRSDDVRWCVLGSATYLRLSFGETIPGPAIKNILSEAFDVVGYRISSSGDGVIERGIFRWSGLNDSKLQIISASVDNLICRRLTWSVLGAALTALSTYMSQADHSYGEATFTIYDGNHFAGQGSIGRAKFFSHDV